MHVDSPQLPIRERLAQWIAHLEHVLPTQAPIRDFVHHNTLHGFQHLPFDAALAAVQRLNGAHVYWPEFRFHAAFAGGRVTREDLAAALPTVAGGDLDECFKGLRRRDILLASLLEPAESPQAGHAAWLLRESSRAEDPLFAACRVLAGEIAVVRSEDWPAVAARRLDELLARLGDDWTWRALLEHLSGEDVLETVRTTLQRHLAAHLDAGVAAWTNPQRGAGFFAAWRASAGIDAGWEIEELQGVREAIAGLPEDASAVLLGELARVMPDEARWPGYLERLALEQAGWAGMVLWRDRRPEKGDGTAVAMGDYLAVRVLLERLLCEDLARRLFGIPLGLAEMHAYFVQHPAELYVRDAWRRGVGGEALLHRIAPLLEPGARSAGDDAYWSELAGMLAAAQAGENPDGAPESTAWRLFGLLGRLGVTTLDGWTAGDARQLLTIAGALDAQARGRVWLRAYEGHYRERMFAALAANVPHRCLPAQVSAQVVMCMDDREEGTRRHLEEIAPSIVTYGAAGFLNLPMSWQGIDDAVPTALCPVVVRPVNLVREEGVDVLESARHAARRNWRLRWRERIYQGTRRSALAGPLLTALAAIPALGVLLASSLAPGWFGSALRRWRQRFEGVPATRLLLTAAPGGEPTPEQPRPGFTEEEQAEYVGDFLRMIGLTRDFAPLVLMLGHGSSSRNNPHFSAYACGACSGKHGGPNARVFASLANRPEVRRRLAARGIDIPDSCWFVAAAHDTCDDSIDWYDPEAVPEDFRASFDQLVGQLAEACRAHAVERCRRLASAPPRPTPWRALRHLRGRASDIAQARPELGHATNAAAFVGRRSMSRGLFLDRRVFLISYDPQGDADGRIAETILLAAAPVGAGISLEYYFSTVDNERFGCGSKVTHNLAGLFGVMEGADSDLRTGLPQQMVEIHEPMRLLVVVEQSTAVLGSLLERQPALRELIGNAWITLAAQHPDDAEISLYCPVRGWLPWSGKGELPEVARSADWFSGSADALPPALVSGGRAQ